MNGSRKQVTRVFIYGSCVSRDTFETLPSDRWGLTGYAARQSLISAAAGAAVIDLPHVQSPFQRRMIVSDAAGDLRTQLERAAGNCDLLLWDLADERLGVRISDNGGVVTRSVDGIKAGVDALTAEWRTAAPGSPEHMERWSASLDWFCGTLDELGLRHRVLLLDVPWAETSTDSTPVPASFGLRPASANTLFPAYVDRVRDHGLAVESLRVTDVVADPRHRWGHAPFHYDRSTYGVISGALTRFVARRRDLSELNECKHGEAHDA